jgi:glycogen(starch) synthase
MHKPIFMIGWEFPPHYSGGLGIACQGLARGLVEQGEKLVFALPTTLPNGGSYKKGIYNPTPQTEMEMIFVNAQLHPYWRGTFGGSRESTRSLHTRAADFAIPSQHLDLYQETQRYGKVVAEAATEYPKQKLIHAHDWMSIPAAIQTRERLRKPLLLQIHSTEFDRSGGGQPNSQIAEIEYEGLQAADKIVAVSAYTKQMIVDKYGIQADKIEVVHNGIDPNPEYHDQPLPQFLANRPVVVFMGRLTIQKGPEYFLAVAKRVLQEEPRAVFVLAGEGDMYQSLLVSAAAQQLTGSVLFAGFLRDKEKEMLYKRATVFVMPSVSEPFGIVALEAAMAGTPVIASKTSGVLEVLPQAEAIDFWDINKMTESVLKFIRHPGKREQQAQQVQQQVKKLDWRDAATRMRTVYKKLLE